MLESTISKNQESTQREVRIFDILIFLTFNQPQGQGGKLLDFCYVDFSNHKILSSPLLMVLFFL